jgi:hypothetical protein
MTPMSAPTIDLEEYLMCSAVLNADLWVLLQTGQSKTQHTFQIFLDKLLEEGYIIKKAAEDLEDETRL